jgi:hypothetical protein
MRLLILTAVVAVFGIVGVSSAFADYAVNRDNPTIVVRTLVFSIGKDRDPNVAYENDRVNIVAAVTNRSKVGQWVNIFRFSNIPGAANDMGTLRFMRPGETWFYGKRFKVAGSELASGTYQFMVYVEGEPPADGGFPVPSVAESTIEIVRPAPAPIGGSMDMADDMSGILSLPAA